MSRVIGLQLEALIDRTSLLSCMNLYRDGANLTRLDDFVEVKV
jgi:hypothetical protein